MSRGRSGRVVAAGLVLVLSLGAVALAAKAGKLDESFSGDGKASVDFGSASDRAFDLLRLGGGDLLALGGAGSGNASNFALARLDGAGQPVGSFGGGDGEVTTAFPGGGFDVATAATTVPGGSVVAAGGAYAGTGEFAIAKYDAATGARDTSFNSTGALPGTNTVDFPDSSSNDAALAVVEDGGKLILAGITASGGNEDLALARFNGNGSLNAGGFGTGGLVQEDMSGEDDLDHATDMAVTPSGKLLVVGPLVDSTGVDAFLARFRRNGELDDGFGGGDGVVRAGFAEKFYPPSFAIALQNDGRAVVAGRAVKTVGADNEAFAFARFTSKGKRDQSFGDHGRVLVRFPGEESAAEDVAIAPGGRIVAAGWTLGDDPRFAIARLKPSGKLDRSFSKDGRVTTNVVASDTIGEIARAVAVQPNGRVVAAGTTGSNMTLIRYLGG